MISRSELKAVKDTRVTIWDNLATLKSRPHVDVGKESPGGGVGSPAESGPQMEKQLLARTNGEKTSES